MDKIIINDLLARGIIGINDWERANKQEILINIILYTDISKSGFLDDLDFSVNYRTISKRVLHHAETSNRFTVEALATDIARICLGEPNVQKVLVRVEKPGAVRFSKSVGVEIERTNKDFVGNE